MEVINNYIGTVYYRVDLDSDGREINEKLAGEPRGQEVRWHPKYRLKSIPSALTNLTSAPYLFSPNFKY